MSEEKYTRCPGCRTVFRVTSEQLALRGGQVRCGHCKAVFDGFDQLVSLAPPSDFDDDDFPVDEASKGPPTITLMPSGALLPSTSASGADAGPPAPERKVRLPPAVDPDEQRRPRWRWLATTLYAAGAVVLLGVLAAQALLHYRDFVAARWPLTKPLLAQACAYVGCSVRPLREIADLSIQASDLQADPAHKGLLILTATLRSRAATALAYPHLELTLTDAQDQVVVRRVLTPVDYAGGTADVAGGIPPNGEVAMKLFIDASATTQAGYRIYLFYP